MDIGSSGCRTLGPCWDLAAVYTSTNSPTTSPTASPTVAPTVAPTLSPTSEPTVVQARTGLGDQSFVLVRPFFDGDADVLAESFGDWTGSGMPCQTSSSGTAVHGTIDMILYYARSVESASNSVLTAVSAIDSSTAPWRACFGAIKLIGANLTAVEDVYDPSAAAVDWNRGPNMQFYRMVQVNYFFSSATYTHTHTHTHTHTNICSQITAKVSVYSLTHWLCACSPVCIARMSFIRIILALMYTRYPISGCNNVMMGARTTYSFTWNVTRCQFKLGGWTRCATRWLTKLRLLFLDHDTKV